VTLLAARRKRCVLREGDALTVLLVTAEAISGCAGELRRIAEVAPEAFHMLLHASGLLVCGRAGVRTGELPPRMLDAHSVP